MIAEFGSLDVGGDRVKWFAEALNGLPARYPQGRGVLFLDRTFTADTAVVRAVRSAVSGWPVPQ